MEVRVSNGFRVEIWVRLTLNLSGYDVFIYRIKTLYKSDDLN